jgi:hypothetical protein
MSDCKDLWSWAVQDQAEATFYPDGRPQPESHVSGYLTIWLTRHPALSSWVGLLVAVITAAVMWLSFNFTLFEYVARLIGANVNRATVIVVLSGVVTLLVLPFFRKRRRALGATLAFAASALFAGLVLVALDGFTYKARITPEAFFSAAGPTRTETDHLWFLLGLWGVPLALLVSHACRLLGAGGRRSTVVVLAVAAAGVGAVAATAHPHAATIAGATKAASIDPRSRGRDLLLRLRRPLGVRRCVRSAACQAAPNSAAPRELRITPAPSRSATPSAKRSPTTSARTRCSNSEISDNGQPV